MPKFVKSQESDEKDSISTMLSSYEGSGEGGEQPTEQGSGKGGSPNEGETGSLQQGSQEGDSNQETEAERLKREYEELKAENERLKQSSHGQGKEQEQPSKQEVEQSLSSEEQKFITDEEVQEIQKDPSKWNSILAKVYNRARQDAMRDVKDVARNVVRHEQQQMETAQKFFGDNPDLVEHRDYVGMVANQLASKYPEWTTNKLLDETAKEVRSRLKIDETAKQTEQNRRDNPAFAAGQGNTGSRQGKGDNRTKQQQQIDALIDL